MSLVIMFPLYTVCKLNYHSKIDESVSHFGVYIITMCTWHILFQ